jgi:hypothetical protein
MKVEFEKVFDKKFTNRSVSALGIETYVPRILAVLNEFVDEKLFFIIEIPSSGRYQNYLINENKPYKPFSIIDHSYWPTQNDHGNGRHVWFDTYGNYQDNIFYYNVNKLFNNPGTDVSDKDAKSIMEFTLAFETTIIKELTMYNAIFIDGFIKNAGHDVVWFNTNSPESELAEIVDLENRYGMKYITKKELWLDIQDKYSIDINELKKDENIFPDGSHLNQQDWKYLIEKYFIPYFKNINI